MSQSIYVSFSDNGMGLSRTRWARCMFQAAIAGVFRGMRVTDNHLSSPYPNVICNLIAHDFLDSGADKLLLIDMDIVFKPEDLALLLSHDLPFVGGIVPKRVLGMELAVWPHEPVGRLTTEGDNPLVDADFGRGFCAIHRSVFEDVKPHVQTYRDSQLKDSPLMHEYFQYKPGGHSEDFAFCELWRSLGKKAYVDRRIFVMHEGNALYPIPGT